MDSSAFAALLSCVRNELTRPREMPVRVGSSVCSMLDVRDPLDGLTREILQQRELYEIEWLLSPLFTPTEQERERCEVALPLSGIDADTEERLQLILAAEGIYCAIRYGHRERPVPVMPVVIERFLRLLHLQDGVNPLLLPLLQAWPEETERRVLTSLARRKVWQKDHWAQIFLLLWQAMVARESFDLAKFRFLTEFITSYRPKNQQELLHALTNLVDAYHKDHEHPVYNQQLEHYQGGNIRSQSCGPEIKAYRLAMTHGLLTDFSFADTMI
ncbi:hypothetical protein [Candidatus Magnetaquicoccus inordinatus]|uniref:hypothetical protein n=1 Tax=Candidatus Magnetaquicoccus inordinatus TaxID=2496818 RepID=UPI00102C09DE|nr:hypothetical protein [Candidatus Magnetaquicoccus inordinatus]